MTDRNEWYTPPHIIAAVRDVLGEIDLDPMSTEEANRTVGAKRIYTKDDNALVHSWEARTLFLNPPYGRNDIAPAIDYFLAEYRRGVIGEALVLVNDCLDTGWGQRMLATCAGMCALNKRISFIAGADFEKRDGSAMGYVGRPPQKAKPDGDQQQEDKQKKSNKSNSKGQVIFYFGHRLRAFERVFEPLGQCVRRSNFVPEDWAPESSAPAPTWVWYWA